MRSNWNQSKLTAVAATLLLHLALMAWILNARPDLPRSQIATPALIWIPERQPPPPLKLRFAIPAPAVQSAPQPPSMPAAALPVLQREHDWYGDARAVAGAFGQGTERRGFGASPAESGAKPQPKPEPTVFARPLARVGTTVTTPEGETILWVSDYCYISLGSTSLTVRDIHQARQGVRQCIIPVGKREPRGDLFDPLQGEPKQQQEPGCRKDGRSPSCTP